MLLGDQSNWFGNATQFATPWWFRAVISVPATGSARLVFHGINYAGQIWVDGALVARVVGTFRHFDVDLRGWRGAQAAVAVLVARPDDSWSGKTNSTDLAMSFIDWAPEPPDHEMGLWQPVSLVVATSSISLSSPFAETTVTSSSNTLDAAVRVLVRVRNDDSQPTVVLISANIPSLQVAFNRTVTINPLSDNDVEIGNFSLHDARSVLWWPWSIDVLREKAKANLHNVTIAALDNGNGQVLDSLVYRAGFRQATGELDGNGNRLFRVNGEPLMVLGGGWTPQLFHENSTRAGYEPHFVLMREMGLNAVRLEGKFEADAFYELADEYGIVTMPGWACCDAFQHWNAWGSDQFAIAAESTVTQARRLRGHASSLVFLVSSDELPPVKVEQMYLDALASVRWTGAVLQSAADTHSKLSGKSGVKMSGPYSYVPPSYWSDPRAPGVAQGFLTEGGPGENPLTIPAAQRTFGSKSFGPPPSNEWDWHCGNPQGVFHNLRFFLPAVAGRLGNWSGAADPLRSFSIRSEYTVFETTRAMFEEYSRARFAAATGVIFWMLNSPWPSSIWHLYDYYFNTNAAFYAVKRALFDGKSAMFSYTDRSVWVVNNHVDAPAHINVTVTARNVTGELIWSTATSVLCAPNAAADSMIRVPQLTNASDVFNLHIRTDGDRSNDYWLPARQQDVLDFNSSNFYRTPFTKFADMSMLTRLGPASVACAATMTFPLRPGWGSAFVLCKNTGATTAVFTKLSIVEDVGMTIWHDNFLTLFPGKAIATTVEMSAPLPGKKRLTVFIETMS